MYNILTIRRHVNKEVKLLPLQLYEKQKILETCFAVFVLNGYTKTSTAMLAEAAGISKALIFHHFKSKKKLYISVLERCFEKMKPETIKESTHNYKDFFEAKEKSGMSRIDLLRNNSDVNKLIFEAFFATPEELKEDISNFKAYMEGKYGDMSSAKDKKMKKLFDEISFREGVVSDEAYELINIVSEHFRIKLAAELTDENQLQDDRYWTNFFEKKSRYINMIRYGIEQPFD
jgi:TetR/AcrR family transcriptional regulator